MTSVIERKPIYLTMLENSIADHREQLGYAYELNKCLFDLEGDKKALQIFCEAIMTKVSDIQLFLGRTAILAAGSISPESIAQFIVFSNQLLHMYEVAFQMYLSISTPHLGRQR